jgi:hypothetical protein
MFLSVVNTGPYFDGFSGFSLVLLVLAVGLGAGWLAVLAWRWFRTFPYLPVAGPATNELGPEPPAIVNLLVHCCRVTRAALLATFADLAARGLIEIQQLDREHFVVRLREQRLQGVQLTSYEQQMVGFIRSCATGGSAPFEALLFDEESAAEGFWNRFRKGVLADALKRGLTRRRWAPHDYLLLGGLLAAVLGLGALAMGVAHLGEGVGSGKDKLGRWDWFYAAAVVWFAAMVWIGAQRSIRYSSAGTAAATRWLGVQRYLTESGAVANVPIAAVVLWEQYLSQGVALGVAHEAAHALPFATEDPESAWSRTGGDWHELHVIYPERFGATQPPGKVLLDGLVRTLFWGALAFVALPKLALVLWDFATTVLDDSQLGGQAQDRALLGFVALFLGVFSIAGLYLVARFFGGVIRVWRGVGDLGKAKAVEGDVVKLHAGRVAIDDGKQRETVAWRPPTGAPGVSRGDRVRVTITPHLHHVSRMEVLSSRPAPADSPSTTSAGQPSGVPDAIDLGVLRRATGLELSPSGGRVSIGPNGSQQVFADGAGNLLTVRVMALPPLALRAISTLSGKIGQRATPVPGLGGEAWWEPHAGLGVVVPGGLALITPQLQGQTADAQLAMAQRVAAVILQGTQTGLGSTVG